MKIKILIILLSFCIIFSACKKDKGNSNPALNEKADIKQKSEEQKKAILYTDMGGSISSDIKQHEYLYTNELNAEKLAEGLTELTGLYFNIKSTVKENGIIIDWKENSTLIANLGDKEQKEDFHFFDSGSMRWFMMESFWLTITKNLGVENVYYTMNNGENLVFEELYPIKEFPVDLPYMGIAFFFSHAEGSVDETDGRGDLIDMSDQPFVGFWSSSKEGAGDRYALFDDGKFIHASSELGSLRELFKIGKWSIINENSDTLELKVEARWVIPTGDIDKIVPSDELVVFKEDGIVKIIYKEPEIEQYSINQADIDVETGRSTITIDGTVFYDFNESTEFLEDFYRLPE